MQQAEDKLFNVQYYIEVDVRLKFLLHFAIFLFRHAGFTLSQLLHLLSGTLKVRLWWGGRDLRNFEK